jgi:hypothetical protein
VPARGRRGWTVLYELHSPESRNLTISIESFIYWKNRISADEILSGGSVKGERKRENVKKKSELTYCQISKLKYVTVVRPNVGLNVFCLFEAAVRKFHTITFITATLFLARGCMSHSLGASSPKYNDDIFQLI